MFTPLRSPAVVFRAAGLCACTCVVKTQLFGIFWRVEEILPHTPTRRCVHPFPIFCLSCTYACYVRLIISGAIFEQLSIFPFG